jgi:hypothetical protein
MASLVPFVLYTSHQGGQVNWIAMWALPTLVMLVRQYFDSAMPVAVVALLLIEFPAYRLFFGISVLIGLVIAGGLTLWYTIPLRTWKGRISGRWAWIDWAQSHFRPPAFGLHLQDQRAPRDTGVMRVLSRFMLSASDAAHFPPPSLPEVAFKPMKQ